MKPTATVRPCVGLICCCLAFYGAGIPAALAAPDEGPTEFDRQVPFALAIRGGVSLGSYEAGFNWALLQYMKTMRVDSRTDDQSYVELRATSGASAGSINALLTTIAWCVDDSRARERDLLPDDASNNVLFDTWLDMGFEELLPEEVASLEHYRADDGVLTRNAFRKTIARMERLLAEDVFRPECEVQFGVLVTRVDAAEKDIAGVRVSNQRFVIPLTMRVDRSGRATFLSCLVDNEDPAFGNVMYLQGVWTGKGDCPIRHDTGAVIDAIEASSAFPIAFGRKYIRYCEPVRKDAMPVISEVGICPDGMRPAFDEFIDGGLFDNIPLGVARALAEPRVWNGRAGSSWQNSGRRFNYIYLDPTIRRSVRQHDQSVIVSAETGSRDAREVPQEVTFGLRSQLRFLGGAIVSSRDYELYNLLRGGDWTNQVSAHADRLAEAVIERFPDTALDHPDLDSLQVMMPACLEFFERDWAGGSEPSGDVINRANECIKASVFLLELDYKGLPLDGELKRCAEITRDREILIDWIVRLAAYIGEDKLAVVASRSRNDKLGDRRILVSSRFSPVIGEMMQAFGGFVDRSFREYDYYAGIYDAVWGISNFLCERQFDHGSCIAQTMGTLHGEIGIAADQPANTVFLYLLRREFAEVFASEEAFSWAHADFGLGTDGNMLAIANSLFGESLANDENTYNAPSMTAFITGLTNQEFDASDSSAFLKRIFKLKDKSELTWYYPLTLRASNRLLILERKESEVMGGGEVYSAGLTLGALYLHSYMQEEELTLNVSTAPDYSWQSWLPDEIAVDARNGGLDLSWYQGRSIGSKGWRWDVKMTPFQLNHSGASRDDYVWFSQADFLVSKKSHGAVSAFGMGPSINWTWEQWPGSEQLNVGAALYMGFVEDKFRISVGKISFRDEFAGGNYFINIGINDVPGFVYWGLSESRGSWWPFDEKP